MKSTVALPITIFLAWLVDCSFSKNPFAANSGTESTTEDHKITGKFELGSVRKEKSQEALQEFVQRLAKTSRFRQLSLGKGSSKFLRQKSSTLANLSPRLFSETDKKDLKEIFSRKLPSQYRKLETLCEGLCDGGVPPSNPALEIGDINGDGIPETCQFFDDFVKAFPVESDVCADLRIGIQPFCCGSSDPCEGLCDGGVPPLNPELEVLDIDGDGTPETCQVLDAIVKLYPVDSAVCVNAMLDIQPLCCNEIPTDLCEGLCDGGAPVINPTTEVLDIDGDGILETCQYLDDNIKNFRIDSNVCQATRFEVAPYCCQTRVPKSSKAPKSSKTPKSSKKPKALKSSKTPKALL